MCKNQKYVSPVVHWFNTKGKNTLKLVSHDQPKAGNSAFYVPSEIHAKIANL